MLIKKYQTLKKLFENIDIDALFEVMKTKVDRRLDKTIFGWRDKWKKSIEAIQTLELSHDPDILLRPLDIKPYIPFLGDSKNDWRPCWISQLEGTNWQNSISRPIYRLPGIDCSDLEIAACALWHLTFYGITPEIQDKYFKESEREAWECLEELKSKTLRAKRNAERKIKKQLITRYRRRRK